MAEALEIKNKRAPIFTDNAQRIEIRRDLFECIYYRSILSATAVGTDALLIPNDPGFNDYDNLPAIGCYTFNVTVASGKLSVSSRGIKNSGDLHYRIGHMYSKNSKFSSEYMTLETADHEQHTDVVNRTAENIVWNNISVSTNEVIYVRPYIVIDNTVHYGLQYIITITSSNSYSVDYDYDSTEEGFYYGLLIQNFQTYSYLFPSTKNGRGYNMFVKVPADTLGNSYYSAQIIFSANEYGYPLYTYSPSI